MDVDKKRELVFRNCEEIIGEEELRKLLKGKRKPVVYCGYEPNGPVHLGHFVTFAKLMDFAKAGFKVKVLLADIHALLNRKGEEREIRKGVLDWKKTIGAIGLKCDIVLGSDFQFKEDYQLDVMKLAQRSSIQRGLRSMQEIARDVKHATISQLWYPLMQVADIKHLGVDVALGGMEQRKVHMVGRDLKRELGHSFVAIHTGLITSLKGPGEKMSKSIQGGGISVVDSKSEIQKALKGAYCPAMVVKNNPVLEIAKLIIFLRFGKIKIKRNEKFGGDLDFREYSELEGAYKKGDLHPLDLKNAVGEYLEEIIGKIRKRD
jgi:tyrosyl-tRNA synthetase